MHKARAVDCAANRITSIPSLEGLECLKILDAMNNAIGRCPELPLVSRLEGVGSGLENLNLAYNNLTLVPPALVLHEKLSEIHLQNNKLARRRGLCGDDESKAVGPEQQQPARRAVRAGLLRAPGLPAGGRQPHPLY